MSGARAETLRLESLAIGDELLDGRVLDSNTRNLGDTLSALGLELQGARTVPDDRALIISALQDAVARSDVIVTSGGLGPTSDDITGECIAEAAGVGMRFDEAAYQRMQAMFDVRGIPMPPSNRRQAVLPATSRTLENQKGTAPGFVTPFVVHGRTVEVWSFPGVPREYEHLRDDYLLPALKARLDGSKPQRLVRRTLRSLGLAESAIGDRLAALEHDNPDVRVQYRAAFPEIIVRLVLLAPADDPSAQKKVEARADALAVVAREAIGRSVFGAGDDPLEVRVLNALRRRGLTVAAAESCTGGLVQKRLTDVPGSSDVFRGGVIAYADDVKEGALGVRHELIVDHGAVSEEVAKAMAQGVRERLGASIAVATTGIAGPGGGSPDKPVGTTWFGVATARAAFAVHKKLPDFGRERVREMASATALRLLLETLEEDA
ncbi:MAG: CinA family nicotinamide mononucleotide deamidase-related protein [Deltaproteobacteria bacterium]|nr:CinA family nicotinamide mononucleotide deamidase-related protein [Deltaproteobacteria bacterium]